MPIYPGYRAADGQGLVEYALLLALIAVVVISVLAVLGTPTLTTLYEIVTALSIWN